MDDRGGDSARDDALFDAVAAVIGAELVAQFGVRRSPRELPAALAYELLRRFDIRGEAADDDVPPPEEWDDWPVIRHVSVDRSNRAHVQLANHPATDGRTVEWELPDRGRVAVTLAADGSVQEVTLWPASVLLPPDVRDDRPLPTTAADAVGEPIPNHPDRTSLEIAHAVTEVLPLPAGGYGARCRCGWFDNGPHGEQDIDRILRTHADSHREG